MAQKWGTYGRIGGSWNSMVHTVHNTKAAAQRKARALTKQYGDKYEAVPVDTHIALPGHRPTYTRANPNPSPSSLKGATILGVTRNKAGKVTALKLRLKPGAGKGSTKRRTNPSSDAQAAIDRAIKNGHKYAVVDARNSRYVFSSPDKALIKKGVKYIAGNDLDRPLAVYSVATGKKVETWRPPGIYHKIEKYK